MPSRRRCDTRWSARRVSIAACLTNGSGKVLLSDNTLPGTALRVQDDAERVWLGLTNPRRRACQTLLAGS